MLYFGSSLYCRYVLLKTFDKMVLFVDFSCLCTEIHILGFFQNTQHYQLLLSGLNLRYYEM